MPPQMPVIFPEKSKIYMIEIVVACETVRCIGDIVNFGGRIMVYRYYLLDQNIWLQLEWLIVYLQVGFTIIIASHILILIEC